jgi:hypothetical protein
MYVHMLSVCVCVCVCVCMYVCMYVCMHDVYEYVSVYVSIYAANAPYILETPTIPVTKSLEFKTGVRVFFSSEIFVYVRPPLPNTNSTRHITLKLSQ